MSLDPKVVLSSGIITDIQVELGKYTLQIKSQRPRKNTIEQTILSPDIETYKRFNEAKEKIYQAVLRKEYKSFYSNIDIELNNECKTLAARGELFPSDKISLSEINISKAYTSQLEKLQEIYIFNEFEFFFKKIQ